MGDLNNLVFVDFDIDDLIVNCDLFDNLDVFFKVYYDSVIDSGFIFDGLVVEFSELIYFEFWIFKIENILFMIYKIIL